MVLNPRILNLRPASFDYLPVGHVPEVSNSPLTVITRDVNTSPHHHHQNTEPEPDNNNNNSSTNYQGGQGGEYIDYK